MKKSKIKTRLKAVDFFCLGGGMSYNIKMAGVEVIAGIDIDPECKRTYESNVEGAKFINTDVSALTEGALGETVPVIQNDDNLIFIGCSPCQYWSLIRTNKRKSEKSKDLLHEFHRFVKFYNPGYVVVENVPGILKRKEESGLNKFVTALEEQGYVVHFEIVNLNDFGVPETRRRFSLVANRVNKKRVFPTKELRKPTVRDFIGKANGFSEIPAGHKDSSDFLHSAAGLSDRNLQRIKLTPKNGGSRIAWAATDLQVNTYKKNSEISFSDTYGRMSWDRPAPTITTRFYSFSNGRFGHPEEDRAISLREGATLQTFPKSYKFLGGNITTIARMIGNAVPPKYAEKIALSIIENYESK